MQNPAERTNELSFSSLGAEDCQAAKINGKMRVVYGNGTWLKDKLVEWLQKLRSGRQGTSDEARPSRAHIVATPDNVVKVEEAVREDRRRSLRRSVWALVLCNAYDVARCVPSGSCEGSQSVTRYSRWSTCSTARQRTVRSCNGLWRALRHGATDFHSWGKL